LYKVNLMAIVFDTKNEQLMHQLIEFADSLQIPHTEVNIDNINNGIALPGIPLTELELNTYLDACEKSEYLSKNAMDDLLKQWK
jgi:hypothetical protein